MDNRPTAFLLTHRKESHPFGQLPVLEVDGEKYAQSNAILRYVGKLTGLYPEDPKQALVVDMVIDTIEDIINLHLRPSMLEKDDSKKMELREQLAGSTYPYYLSRLESLAKKGDGFIAGPNMTIADLHLYNHMVLLALG